MAGGNASRARTRIEIERNHDVRTRGDDRRSNRAFPAHSRTTGTKWRVHGIYLLDVSTPAHGSEGEAPHWSGRIFAHTSAGPNFPGQYRQRAKFLGDARPGDRADRPQIR